MSVLPYIILAIIGCNVAVFLLACRNAVRREKAKQSSPNIVDLDQYRRGSLVDVRV